ncbi:MAG: double zinc ribbon domain-containing protein [Clostridiales Family XIII bacterium]|jgi:predicted amidophosphoribosyltransferase|nr:double zinc ribbon domain-containing protein [Clostridiales Family XIII bacterium]
MRTDDVGTRGAGVSAGGRHAPIDRALGAALNLLFPSDIYCAACGAYIDGTRPYALCDTCVREIAWHAGDTCAVCGKALAPRRSGGVCHDCRESGRAFDAGASCCTYTGPARDLVRAMKYKDSAWIAVKLADVMYDRLRQLARAEVERSDRVRCNRDRSVVPPSIFLLGPSVVIPVPMTEAKRRKRGYDQAEIIARRLAKLIDAPFGDGVLRRKRDTSVMSGLGLRERRANMVDAFEVATDIRESASDGVAEERGLADGFGEPALVGDESELSLFDVLLVDDVFTTGSTADACAAALKEAGAKRVTLFTFAAGADVDPRAATE